MGVGTRLVSGVVLTSKLCVGLFDVAKFHHQLFTGNALLVLQHVPAQGVVIMPPT